MDATSIIRIDFAKVEKVSFFCKQTDELHRYAKLVDTYNTRGEFPKRETCINNGT